MKQHASAGPRVQITTHSEGLVCLEREREREREREDLYTL